MKVLMGKLVKFKNQIIYWFLVRRHHIDEINFESEDGKIIVNVGVGGKRYKVSEIRHLDGISQSTTDYGIYSQVARKIKERRGDKSWSQRLLGATLCKCWGHLSYFDKGSDITGPSTCTWCGHKDAGIKYTPPPMPVCSPAKESDK